MALYKNYLLLQLCSGSFVGCFVVVVVVVVFLHYRPHSTPSPLLRMEVMLGLRPQLPHAVYQELARASGGGIAYRSI